jgi:transcriptional antiterminator
MQFSAFPALYSIRNKVKTIEKYLASYGIIQQQMSRIQVRAEMWSTLPTFLFHETNRIIHHMSQTSQSSFLIFLSNNHSFFGSQCSLKRNMLGSGRIEQK